MVTQIILNAPLEIKFQLNYHHLNSIPKNLFSISLNDQFSFEKKIYLIAQLTFEKHQQSKIILILNLESLIVPDQLNY